MEVARLKPPPCSFCTQLFKSRHQKYLKPKQLQRQPSSTPLLTPAKVGKKVFCSTLLVWSFRTFYKGNFSITPQGSDKRSSIAPNRRSLYFKTGQRACALYKWMSTAPFIGANHPELAPLLGAGAYKITPVPSVSHMVERQHHPTRTRAQSRLRKKISICSRPRSSTCKASHQLTHKANAYQNEPHTWDPMPMQLTGCPCFSPEVQVLFLWDISIRGD